MAYGRNRVAGWDFATRQDLAGFNAPQSGLGLSLGPILKIGGTLIGAKYPTAGAAVSSVGDVMPVLKQAPSGGSGRYWANIPNLPGDPPAATVVAAMRNAPPDLVAQFISELAAANNGEKLSPTDLTDLSYAPYWIAAALGGADRKATTTHGKQANALLFEILKYASTADTSYGGSSSDPYYGGGGPPPYAEPPLYRTPTPATKSDDGGLLEWLKNEARRIGTQAAVDAVPQVTNRLPPEVQRAVVQQYVTPGAVFDSIPTSVKIAGGVAAAALLVRLLRK